MRKKLLYPTAVACAITLSVPAVAQLTKTRAIAKAETVLENLQQGKTADLVKEFDSKVAAALPEAKLKSVWPAVVGQFGAFKNITDRREGQYQERHAVELTLAFEKATIIFRTVFDAEGKVGGMVFRPLDQAVLPPAKLN
jgi:hypothetical protein